ncbi:glycosyltransferase [Priestia megaterium]|uniref:glycosyltransferase family 2 protein n=1 Tax=Priestia megaterium TaxID=1404 RepID=UPI001B39E3D9|nr:glycosyltransferase family 2 protein [Priestia megaterium]MBQ4867834.1 glycosyltransferase [Priestia megaterium]
MNEKVKISVITPCFNSEKSIARTIESVKNQTYRNIEYIIIDGGSTDNTLEIIRGYEPDFKGRMLIVSEKDKGIYDAMNKGITRANGDLIGIVNSDDYYELDAVENIVKNRTNHEYQIIYGLLRTIKDDKEIMVYSKSHTNLNNAMITHPTCFVSKQIYRDFGMYNLNYRFSADYEFMLRASRNTEVNFKEIYNIISNFSIDGASSTIRGYRDTLRLKKEYGLISNLEYRYKMIKSKISMWVKK